MSTKPQTETESNGDQPAADADDVELSRPFLVEASGPVTKRTRVSGGLVETEETEVSIIRRAGTLEAFDAFYSEHNTRDWKKNVIQRLLSEEAPEDVVYEFHADDWDVQVDGRVDAFRGVIDVLADADLETGGDPRMGGADYSSKLVSYHHSLTEAETLDEDEAFAKVVDDCRQSPLFGPGAAIAELDAKHSARKDLEGYVEQLLEDVRENGGEN